MGEILIADLETNGFKPDVIWVVGIIDCGTGVYEAYTGERVAEGLMRLAEADLVIGHNFIEYDAKVIERLTDGMITLDRSKIVDTLTLGRELLPDMKTQSLAEWGEIFGYPKILFENFSRFDHAMVPYCERDCVITKMIFDFLMGLMAA